MSEPSKRAIRKATVRDFLLSAGPSTLPEISEGTHLSAAAVSKALQDIRNDPAYQYATVATRGVGYTYRIAETVEQTRPGILREARELLTRAESMFAVGEKVTAIAETPADYELGADLKVSGKMLRAQAASILAAIS